MLSWSAVRSLGELQILTRASYVMLIAVPLLAGLWPEVRTFLDDVGGLRGRFAAANVAPTAPGTAGKLADVPMPEGWAIAFFAALAATIAHLIYQSLAPALVRLDRREDYAQRRCDEYARQPTPELFREAASRLKLSAAHGGQEIGFKIIHHITEATRKAKQQESVPAYHRDRTRELLRMLSAEEREDLRKSFDGRFIIDTRPIDVFEQFTGDMGASEPIGRQAFELDVVRQGADRHYRTVATGQPLSVVIVAILYGTSLSLILWLTYTQSQAVALAARWPWPF